MLALFSRPDLRDEFFASPAVGLEMYGCLSKSLRTENDRISQTVGTEKSRKLRQNLRKKLRKRSRQTYLKAVREFELDYRVGANITQVAEPILARALDLARTYPDRDLSPMDLIHAATVEELSTGLEKEGANHNVILITCDRPLKKLGQDRGIDVWDPIVETPAALKGHQLFD